MYKSLLKPFFFRYSPEKAHHLTMSLFNFALKLPFGKWIFKKLYVIKNPTLEKQYWGLTFPNPVGLAAGFDKDGKYFDTLPYLGFGFIEIGTVTPQPQIGNPLPRLFRLPAHDALINRMGFNNEGVDKLVDKLKTRKKSSIIIGGNIGKNKMTTNEDAYLDYQICFEKLFNYVDYFVVNVSSPNTPNLRALQDKEPLKQLLQHLQYLNLKKEKPKPILLKIAPDLSKNQLNDILEIVSSIKLAGIVATNTTISRELVKKDPLSKEVGGLSGKPVKDLSTEVIRYLRKKGPKDLVIIGVGGIHSAENALEKIKAGANLIQLYTGLIYEGPSLIKKINEALLKNN